MRIKKIEWEKIDDGGNSITSSIGKLIKTANLPFGNVALIREYHDHFEWMIKLKNVSLNHISPLGKGETEYLHEAEKAAQNLYEKTITRAFEEDMSCVFCRLVDKTKPINAGGDINIAVISSVDNSPGSMVIETKRFGVSIASKYCFNCGRRLGGASNVRRFG